MKKGNEKRTPKKKNIFKNKGKNRSLNIELDELMGVLYVKNMNASNTKPNLRFFQIFI